MYFPSIKQNGIERNGTKCKKMTGQYVKKTRKLKIFEKKVCYEKLSPFVTDARAIVGQGGQKIQRANFHNYLALNSSIHTYETNLQPSMQLEEMTCGGKT